jgi:hypothetical protein
MILIGWWILLLLLLFLVVTWGRLFARENAELPVNDGRDFACCAGGGTPLK